MTDKKEKENRIKCPLDDFPDAFVVIPERWLGEHCERRDDGIKAAQDCKVVELANLSISLFLADSFGGIPGIENDDPTEWELGKVPLEIMIWLTRVVNDSFSACYNVPKNS